MLSKMSFESNRSEARSMGSKSFIVCLLCVMLLFQYAKGVEPPHKPLSILVMRHGTTYFNKMISDYLKEMDVKEYTEPSNLRAIESSYAVDSLLTEKGIEQCLNASRTIKKEFGGVKYVFLSPSRRTVQTAIFATREISKSRTIEYHLLPWLREKLQTVADLGTKSIGFLKKNYPWIDRTCLHNSTLWVFDYWDLSHNEKSYGNDMMKSYSKGQNMKKMLEILKKGYKEVENVFQVKARTERAKEWIFDFIEKKRKKGIIVKDNEILVVAHYMVLEALCGNLDENGKPDPKYKPFANAEIRKFILEKS